MGETYKNALKVVGEEVYMGRLVVVLARMVDAARQRHDAAGEEGCGLVWAREDGVEAVKGTHHGLVSEVVGWEDNDSLVEDREMVAGREGDAP